MMRGLARLVVSVVAFSTIANGVPPTAGATPAEFEDTLVTKVSGPTALAFLPDGRMLITSHFGTLWIFDSRTGQTTSALTLTDRVCSDQERGLLGVAVDPNFASDGSSGFIYLYYTFKKHGVCELNTSRSPVNRVSKFVLNGGTVDPASETILIDPRVIRRMQPSVNASRVRARRLSWSVGRSW